MSVWGLVMAKARATFTMTDIIDKDKRKQSSNKIFYICLLIGASQLLKSCADNNYADKLVSNIENEID